MRDARRTNKHINIKLALSLLLGLVMMTMMSANTYAAPKQMPDGNLFDVGFYVAAYPDIAAVLGTDETILYNHYVLCGKAEGRIPYQSVTDQILALQATYPEGMKWDESSTYTLAKDEKRDNGRAGWQVTACQAFAYMVQDAVFGTSAAFKMHETGLENWMFEYGIGMITQGEDGWYPIGYYGQDASVNAKFEEYWDKIQPGDALADANHIVVVLTKTDDFVTVVEGNYNGTVHWGRMIHKRDLRMILDHVESPYW